jgi:hypothetical protein
LFFLVAQRKKEEEWRRKRGENVLSATGYGLIATIS